MLQSALGYQGCITAPHRAAALAGHAILAEGGTAIEAVVAAAATIAVTYPHMNGLGGDAFWLIKRAGKAPLGISGAGRAASLATVELYREAGYVEIPTRGGNAALLVPGAVSTWQLALNLLPKDQRLSLDLILSSALRHATDGIAVSENLADTLTSKATELAACPGFSDVFHPDGTPPKRGQRLYQPGLASTLSVLADKGLEAFYRGSLASTHAAALQVAGSPLRLEDFENYEAEYVDPISVKTSAGTLYNLPPPTQGLTSLMILALFDRLAVKTADGFEHIHALVEATKYALRVRNQHIGDPDTMTRGAAELLACEHIKDLAHRIDDARAQPWPGPSQPGGTVWMGAIDRFGTAVSFIQSVFWEFGSGVTCPETGIVFQNRGAGFTLTPGPNALAPGKRPLHTLNPALAVLNDGRTMAYGTMGGDGQPQTQAAVLTRYAVFGQDLQRAITAPRWLLGRTWGNASTSLKLEGRVPSDVVASLKAVGHDIEVLDDFSEAMGHAGAVVSHPSGLLEAASDPRSDGAALAF